MTTRTQSKKKKTKVTKKTGRESERRQDVLEIASAKIKTIEGGTMTTSTPTTTTIKVVR